MNSLLKQILEHEGVASIVTIIPPKNGTVI